MTVRSRLHRAIVSAMAGAILLTGVGFAADVAVPRASADVAETPGLTPGVTLSGAVFHGGAHTADAVAFGNWRGAPVRSVTAYTSTDTWQNIDNVTGKALTAYWTGLGAHMVWSVPLIPMDKSSTLEIAATGAYNFHYVKIAQGLISGGDANATIRLGWEFTGDWYAWNGIKDPAAFAETFRQAVTAMRSVPGQHFTFDWAPALGRGNPTPMYPGNSFVDTVGADIFDSSWAGSYPATDHVAVWNALMTGLYNWDWLADFAAQHGKRLSLAEWGVHYMCDGHGGGDDPYFIDQIRKLINTEDIAFANYFETDDSSCSRFTLTSGLFPDAANEYRKLFSTPVDVGTTPPPPPTAAPIATPTTEPGTLPTVLAPGVTAGPPQLMFSNSRSRSPGAPLDKQTIVHGIYVFYPTVAGVKSIAFWLDGKPYRSATRAPWDLVGTGTTGPKAFRPNTLTAGRHSIAATVTMSAGNKIKATASFLVPPAAAKARIVPATSNLLGLSNSPFGHTRTRLNGATFAGHKYVLFSAIAGTVRAQYLLDGTVIRTLVTAVGGQIRVAPKPTESMRKGVHHVQIRMRALSGQLSVATASFRVT